MSILKVNTIQDKGGNTIISSDGSGVITPSFGVGKIGQVVQATNTTSTATTSTTYVSTNFTGSITPSATSSKVFGMLQCRPYVSAGGTEMWLKISGGGRTQWEGYTVYSSAGAMAQNMTITFEDVPNSTSSITYLVEIKSANGNNVIISPNGGNDGTGRITLMEVLA